MSDKKLYEALGFDSVESFNDALYSDSEGVSRLLGAYAEKLSAESSGSSGDSSDKVASFVSQIDDLKGKLATAESKIASFGRGGSVTSDSQGGGGVDAVDGGERAESDGEELVIDRLIKHKDSW